jgi:hypothetical protein
MSTATRKTSTATTKRLEKIDPSIVALDLHKKADQVFFARSRVADDRPDDHEAEQELDRASTAADHFAWELATTEPTTLAGASAVLSYIVDGPSVGLFDLGETAWHETAFRTVASALAKMARSSRIAA